MEAGKDCRRGQGSLIFVPITQECGCCLAESASDAARLIRRARAPECLCRSCWISWGVEHAEVPQRERDAGERLRVEKLAPDQTLVGVSQSDALDADVFVLVRGQPGGA